MTPGEVISSLVAINCPTLASAEMFSSVWSSALMDDSPGQHLLRGLDSYLVPSHSVHTLTKADLPTKRSFRPHCSCSASWLTPKPSLSDVKPFRLSQGSLGQETGRAVEALSVFTHSTALSTLLQGHLTSAVGKLQHLLAFPGSTLGKITSSLCPYILLQI